MAEQKKELKNKELEKVTGGCFFDYIQENQRCVSEAELMKKLLPRPQDIPLKKSFQ